MRPFLALVVLAAFASAAHAQQKEPLPRFVIDARAVVTKLGQDARTAGDLGLQPTELPATGFGGAVGANVYVWRRPKLSLGLGGEGVLARAAGTPTDSTGAPTGPRVERRLQGVSGTLSLNFGHRQGWSYLSAGLGPLRFQTFTGDLPTGEPPPFTSTQNFGFGARWFAKEHLAFCFDLRFYLTKPADPSGPNPGRDRLRLLVFSAGISIK
jgi:hypothetical protein